MASAAGSGRSTVLKEYLAKCDRRGRVPMTIVPKPDRRGPNDENLAEIAALIAILEQQIDELLEQARASLEQVTNPPAKPGAFKCEPLKAARRGR